MILYALSLAQEHMARVVDKIILLAPTSWQELPGPSFLDPVMDHIKELEPQEIWGLGWPESR